MTRRDALLRLTALCGGTIFGADRFFLSAPANAADAPANGLLSADDLALLDEIGDTILPATEGSAGAKAANIGDFMQTIVRDFYDQRERGVFATGLAQLNQVSAAKFDGRGFMALTAAERHELLLTFDRLKPQPEFYRMIKQLTMWGYFSSEIGAKQALTHVPVPGMYQGCINVEPGAKAWAR